MYYMCHEVSTLTLSYIFIIFLLVNWFQFTKNYKLKVLFFLSDLKAFERRLTEVIARLQPATTRWRSKYLCIDYCWCLIYR